jgi:hypothetical protein
MKPMTMTQKKAEEAKKRARAAQMRSESKARRGRTASTTAVGGQRNKQQAPMDAERAANMAMVKKDRPMPKRPSATSLANAATPKPTRPAKPQTPPTTAPRPPKAEAPAKPTAKKPPRPLRGTVTGKGGRNVGEGRDKRANVTREQLQETGMTLRQYLNFMDREGKRPSKKSGVDKVPNKKGPRKKMMRGGMMKSKMKAKGYKAGGKMKTKGYKAGGQMKEKSKFPDLNKDGKVTQADILQGRGVVKKKAGGMMKSKGYAKGGAMKTKGYAKGGMMKSKGYAKGGVAGGKKQKVRGAGIARRGVRPAKMR